MTLDLKCLLIHFSREDLFSKEDASLHNLNPYMLVGLINLGQDIPSRNKATRGPMVL